MALSAATIAAIIGGAVAITGATAGAIGSAVKTKNAKDESSRSYKDAKSFLESQYYRDPLSTVGNKSLLKSAKQAYKDNLDAVDNRMVAGGATMENQLAARQATNEGMDRLYGQLLLGEDARRDSIAQQRLQLDQNYSLAKQQDYYRSAQNWQAWGSQVYNAGMSVAQSSLLNGYGGSVGGGSTFGGAVQSVGSTPASSMPGNAVTSSSIGANGLAGGLSGKPSYLG